MMIVVETTASLDGDSTHAASGDCDNKQFILFKDATEAAIIWQQCWL